MSEAQSLGGGMLMVGETGLGSSPRSATPKAHDLGLIPFSWPGRGGTHESLGSRSFAGSTRVTQYLQSQQPHLPVKKQAERGDVVDGRSRYEIGGYTQIT